MDHDNREIEVLRKAAMSLLCMISGNHPIECTCEHCKAACQAVFYLPTLRQSHAQEWKRRTDVQKVHEKEVLGINPHPNPRSVVPGINGSGDPGNN